ncbi:MAG: hypothetical protein GFH27_549311n53 [Chloroflexi bacterium AL-W]|nr:hypothetical protein [Chloroflexi bacterium AL-N1]NOK68769.1 hypothetical protein [Chloroflexi bacterium AL-N10]NOK76255.1 hypothetical protein [Chloroflexi bacterium AL-N5]NOK84108.1 hypothetical protein [Chloroflexi bacterium AL-W]NOK91393.1 hypothetical protein [Chloroflexi bacterium AL-N15]
MVVTHPPPPPPTRREIKDVRQTVRVGTPPQESVWLATGIAVQARGRSGAVRSRQGHSGVRIAALLERSLACRGELAASGTSAAPDAPTSRHSPDRVPSTDRTEVRYSGAPGASDRPPGRPDYSAVATCGSPPPGSTPYGAPALVASTMLRNLPAVSGAAAGAAGGQMRQASGGADTCWRVPPTLARTAI